MMHPYAGIVYSVPIMLPTKYNLTEIDKILCCVCLININNSIEKMPIFHKYKYL